MSGKSALILVLVLGLVTVVYQVSMRLSTEAINIIVGMACGIAATVPVSLGLLLALTRERSDRPRAAEEPEEDYGQSPEPVPYYPPQPPRLPYPQVVVLAPPQNSAPNPYQNLLPPGSFAPGYNMNEPPRTRDFKIIGDDEEWDA